VKGDRNELNFNPATYTGRPGAGHRLAEEASKEMLVALTEFLAPYRESRGGLR
jgi:hypothetical protein